jgi:hypothetical protein
MMNPFTQNQYVILIAALLFKHFPIKVSLKSFTKLVFKNNNNGGGGGSNNNNSLFHTIFTNSQ